LVGEKSILVDERRSRGTLEGGWIVLADRLKDRTAIELPEPRPGQAHAPIYQPITLAAPPSGIAFGVLARIAAVLRRCVRDNEARRLDDGTDRMGAASFIVGLAPEERRLLARLAVNWEQPAGEMLRSMIAQVEDAAAGSGAGRTLRRAA